MIESAFAVFTICALLLFRFAPAPRAAALTCIAGWLLLPVGHYPPGSAEASFAYWVVGVVLPSDMLLTKAWIPPVVALLGALIADRKAIARWRPRWMDLPLLLWCTWPLGQSLALGDTAPPAWITSIYLFGAWGAPWMLGRIYFSTPEGANEFLSAFIVGLVVIIPIAIFETVIGPILYGLVYEVHPFRFDGNTRYFGFRPIGFFEHGNQYGIWVAATAVAAVWLWSSTNVARGARAIVAVFATGLALLSQSIGAIALMLAGFAALWASRRSFMRWAIPVVIVLVVGSVGTYLTAAGPLRTFAETTGVGRKIVDVVRATGRGSVLWRFARDQKAIAIIKEDVIVGSGQWDWWRPNKERPWNLSFLILGEFGIIGVILVWSALLLPVFGAVASRWRETIQPQDTAAPLMIMVVMAVGDAQLNSFFFYPAIVAAGALVTTTVSARQPITKITPRGTPSPAVFAQTSKME